MDLENAIFFLEESGQSSAILSFYSHVEVKSHLTVFRGRSLKWLEEAVLRRQSATDTCPTVIWLEMW